MSHVGRCENLIEIQDLGIDMVIYLSNNETHLIGERSAFFLSERHFFSSTGLFISYYLFLTSNNSYPGSY